MSTAVATRNADTALSIHPDQAGFTETQAAALRQVGVQANSPADVAVFFHQCKRTGLDPFKREIYMITRKGKPTIQTGIDGFYKIADRATRATRGSWGIPETLWCGEDGKWTDVWLQRKAPAAAKVTVERDGSRFTVVALTSEYAAGGPMWDRMPARMIAKCAEALAIRKAFPDDMNGLYTSEEMAQAERDGTPADRAYQRTQGSTLPPSTPTPAPAVGPNEDATPVPMIGREQWADIVNVLKALGVTGNEAMLAAIGNELDREVTRGSELTAEEAEIVLARLAEAGNVPASEPAAGEPIQGDILDEG